MRKNPNVWLESVKNLGVDSAIFRLFGYWTPGVVHSSNLVRAWLQIYRARFGLTEAPCLEMYREHNEWVRKIVPKGRLLEFEPSMGWGPLCDFLGKKAPIGIPFPCKNGHSHIKSRIRAAMVTGAVIWVIYLGILSYCIFLLRASSP